MGMLDIKFWVSVSSNWSLHCGEMASVWHRNSIGSHTESTRLFSSWVLDSHLSCRKPLDSPSTSRYRLTRLDFEKRQTGNETSKVRGFFILISSRVIL